MSKKIKLLLIPILLVLVIIIVSLSFVTIPEGYIGLRYQFGKIVDVNTDAGLHFKVPFVETVTLVDIREQVLPLTTTAYTSDTQTVEAVELKVNYVVSKSSAAEIQRTVGIANVADKLILPRANAILKNEIGHYRAENLIQSRNAVQEQVEKLLSDELSAYGVQIISLSIVNIDFDDSFEEAVRAKVVAEQDALKAQNKTKEKEEQAKQTVIEAQAQADSNKLIADSEAYAIRAVQEALAQNPQYIEWEKIKKWDGKLPQAMGNEINPFFALDSAE